MTGRELLIEIIRGSFWATSLGALVGAWYAVAVVRAAERDVLLATQIDDGLRREMRRALILARVLGAVLVAIAFICANTALQGYWAPWRRLVSLVVFLLMSWLLVWVARYLAQGLRQASKDRAMAASLRRRRDDNTAEAQ